MSSLYPLLYVYISIYISERKYIKTLFFLKSGSDIVAKRVRGLYEPCGGPQTGQTADGGFQTNQGNNLY